MKTKIIVEKEYNKLHFYLLSRNRKSYLFTQRYTKGVYNFFRFGRSENEIRAYKKWNRNQRLDKTIEKIPMYVQYVMYEVA